MQSKWYDSNYNFLIEVYDCRNPWRILWIHRDLCVPLLFESGVWWSREAWKILMFPEPRHDIISHVKLQTRKRLLVEGLPHSRNTCCAVHCGLSVQTHVLGSKLTWIDVTGAFLQALPLKYALSICRELWSVYCQCRFCNSLQSAGVRDVYVYTSHSSGVSTCFIQWAVYRNASTANIYTSAIECLCECVPLLV